MSENNKMDWVKWVGSLLGRWWILPSLFLLGSLLVGPGGFILVVVLGLASALMLAVTRPESFKFAWTQLVSSVKSWWGSRPKS